MPHHFLVEAVVVFLDFLEVKVEGHEFLGFLGDFQLDGGEAVRSFGVNHRLMLVHKLQTVMEEERTHERQSLEFLSEK